MNSLMCMSQKWLGESQPGVVVSGNVHPGRNQVVVETESEKNLVQHCSTQTARSTYALLLCFHLSISLKSNSSVVLPLPQIG